MSTETKTWWHIERRKKTGERLDDDYIEFTKLENAKCRLSQLRAAYTSHWQIMRHVETITEEANT